MGYASVEDYLASFSDESRAVLERVRASIREAIPDAEERVSYGIVKLEVAGKHALYFGGWKNHVGMYPIPLLPDELEQEVAPYRSTKDSLHFPFREDIPYGLITRIAMEVAGDVAKPSEEQESEEQES